MSPFQYSLGGAQGYNMRSLRDKKMQSDLCYKVTLSGRQ